jgi:serine protease AprX
MPGRTTGVAIVLLLTAPLASAASWRTKVDPWIFDSARSPAGTEFLIVLAEQADLRRASQIVDKAARGRYVYETLRATAESTQTEVVAELDRLAIPYRRFWIANMVWARGDLEAVERLAARKDVSRIHANPRVSASFLQPSKTGTTAPQGIEWNLVRIGAPDFWAGGHAGAGVVLAGQDTGYDWQHPAIKNQYRGWNGLTADHDYNWHDAIHTVGPGSACGADSAQPCDDHNHGTHTMGIMVGDDGGVNQIGVAPEARWIGCRNMDENGVGSPATYAECFEFFVAPTRIDGSDADPSRAPHVVSNSWTCPPSEGCTDPDALLTVVENTRAAGIVVVASAGNEGPGCNSISSPPAIYDAALTVGATDSHDAIWSQSSRGGIAVDGSQRLKPNVVAPGVGVRSSIPNGGYSTWSGTSMAAPHVAGQIALLISATPALAGRVETLESCIEATATPLTNALTCSGINGDNVPNNSFGRGRIALALPLPVECSEAFVFRDDFEAGQPSSWD